MNIKRNRVLKLEEKAKAPLLMDEYWRLKELGVPLERTAQRLGITRPGLSDWFVQARISQDEAFRIADAVDDLAQELMAWARNFRRRYASKKVVDVSLALSSSVVSRQSFSRDGLTDATANETHGK